jgi:group II intron reverse transcriptase/maturase
MDQVVSKANLLAALKRVRQNKGAPGTDGMTTDELRTHLKEHWPKVKSELMAATYKPTPIKHVPLPKPGGGTRHLGIPTVLDRFIQQAILQVLSPLLDPTFSTHSYGFRPGKSAHQAVKAARAYASEGRIVVVDLDLENFFDRINHDILMDRLSKRIADKRLLRLIRSYLEAGIMVNGVVMERKKGTPQGGPLSPILANLILDEVDRELEKRGHTFVRYADDLNVYVKSQRAGERVKTSLTKLYEKLHLKVNESKSAVAKIGHRKLLGFSFWVGADRKPKLRLSPQAQAELKHRVRKITRRSGGRSMQQVADKLKEYLTGWKNYFHIVETPGKLTELDEWIRHRLRAVQLKHWKRGTTVFRELTKRGLSKDLAARVAGNTRSWWRNSAMGIHVALPIAYFDKLGVPRLGRRTSIF